MKKDNERRVKNLIMENCTVLFRNFKGVEKKWNDDGQRNFCVILEDDVADAMKADGWNVKALKPREEGDPERKYIQVAVSFKNIPPKVVLVTSNGKTDLTEDTIGVLDYAELENVDLILSPYHWQLDDGREGIKAYLKTGYFTIVEDIFEKKYEQIGNAHIDNEVMDVEEVPF